MTYDIWHMSYVICHPDHQTILSQQANDDSGNELILPAFLTANLIWTPPQAPESRCVQFAQTFRLSWSAEGVRYRERERPGADGEPGRSRSRRRTGGHPTFPYTQSQI